MLALAAAGLATADTKDAKAPGEDVVVALNKEEEKEEEEEEDGDDDKRFERDQSTTCFNRLH